MIVNNNASSISALSNLNSNEWAIQKSISRLSSGLKIVTGADDAAGLAISEKMRAQKNALDQARQNALDGYSMLQTAEGALNTAHNILQRLNVLAMRSANDAVLTDDDRTAINNEATALRQELDRMSATIEFNTKPLLDGSVTGAVLQVGIDDTTNSQITVTIQSVNSADLGIDSIDLSTATGAQSALTPILNAINSVSENRGDIGAVMNRLEHTIKNIDIQYINTTAAESRVRDVDMAVEMSNFVKLQILNQTSTAALAQANMLPQSVLALLR